MSSVPVSAAAAPANPIPGRELLSRFVFRRDHVRSNGEVKPEAFIPHPHAECSVTRHAALTSEQVWERGEGVATKREMPLLGRAELAAGAVRSAGLEPVSAPVEDNAEHANIVGWPSGKPLQKHQAQLLVKHAAYSIKPSVS